MLEDAASLVSLLLRVRNLDVAADWYRSHLGVEVATGADGRHRIGSFELAATVLSLWELQDDDEEPHGSTSDPYPVVVVSGGIEPLHTELRDAGQASAHHVQQELRAVPVPRDADGNVFEVSHDSRQSAGSASGTGRSLSSAGAHRCSPER